MKKSAAAQLDDLLIGAGVGVKFGLRAQGHIPTVNFMLAMGSTWDEIGRAIGWHGPTAKKFYDLLSAKLKHRRRMNGQVSQ